MTNEAMSIGNKWVVLAVSTFGAFMVPFDSSVVTLAIPSIGGELGGDLALLSWVPVATLLSMTSLVLVFGRLADLKGRRRLYSMGIATFTGASFACAISSSIYQLIAIRAIQGIGASMISGNSEAFIVSAFPLRERGRALGINTTAVYSGISLGPSLGGFLIGNLGWRSVFYVNIPLGAIVMLLLLTVGEPIRANHDAALDLLGAASLTCSVASAIAAATFSRSKMVSPSTIWVLSGIAAIAIVFFIIVESKIADSPLIDLNFFTQNRMFACSNITALLNYQAVYALPFLMSLYLQTVRQMKPQDAGIVLLFQPILMTIISPASGWLSDTIQPRILVSLGMSAISFATALLSRLTEATPLVHVVLLLILLGTGYGLFSSPNTNAVMGAVGKESFGVAAGTLATMRFLGQSMSLAISTWVLLSFIPSGILEIGEGMLNAPIDQFMAGLSMVFIVSSIISALGVAVSLARGAPSGRSLVEIADR